MQGTTINGYSIVSLIGRGGMAEVWKAQNSIGVSVAIKVLNANLSQDAHIVERFKGEARIMAALKHQNIREVRDLATLPDGRPCIIMEYLEGADLASRMKSGERFTDGQLRKWWNQMVSVLNYTHLHGVIHRDIKPSNIFVTESGDVKLLDFGIAKDADNLLSTMTGAKMGTLMYMSPEQVKDAKHIDEKSDVYSLAVTFVHLVSGRSPYASTDSEYSIMTNIVNTPLDTSTLPEPWRRWLNLYLAKEPQNRPQLKRIPESGSQPDGTMVDGGVGGTKDRTIVDSGLYLTVTKGKTYFSAGGGNSSVLVKTNGEYSLQLPKDGWVSGRKYGTNGYSLFISKNTSKTARKSPVKIISTKGIETKEETFNITQEGKKSLWWIWILVLLVLWGVSCIWLMPLNLKVSPQNVVFNSFGGNEHLHPDVKYLAKIRSYDEKNMSVSVDANWIDIKIVYEPNFYIYLDCKENYEYNDRYCNITIETKYGFSKEVVNVRQKGKINAAYSKSGSLNGHEYIDLGLPSGTKWATCNVGADSKYQSGDYYAWGSKQKEKIWIKEVSINNGKLHPGETNSNAYSWKSYKYSNGPYSNTLTKYCTDPEWGDDGFVDNLRTLQPSDDVATSLWGKGWRIPTKSEFEELLNECKWENGTGVKIKVTGPNGNYIIFPDPSCWNAGKSDLLGGGYWSSSLYVDLPADAYCLYLNENKFVNNRGRNCGLLVRPVCK